jgi:hypothetical protein
MDRLEGWKVISAFLHRSMRWCVRYQRRHGKDPARRLPVYRLDEHDPHSRVCARAEDLIAWESRMRTRGTDPKA